jgi:GxxExxY protein
MTNELNGTNKARKLVGPDVVYPDLSYRIMEAVFEVHNRLGPGFSEEIYLRALIAELEVREIPFEIQKSITIHYREKMIGTYRLDLVVDGKIIIEIKSRHQPERSFQAASCILSQSNRSAAWHLNQLWFAASRVHQDCQLSSYSFHS